jgi:hypothetical protein
MVGQIRAADAFGKFANVSSLVWLQQVKETKIYKDLPDLGTWENFCNYVGLSRQKVDLDLQNLATFGEEFLLTVSSLSVGYRDLRKLRQLSIEGAVVVGSDAVEIGGERIPLNADHKEDLQAAILGQKTPQEVAGILAGSIENLPIPKNKWGHPLFRSAAERAEVITGLETGRAFSIATQKSLESAGDAVPGLKKMWLHAGHPRTPRQSHLYMHGQTRDSDKAFYDTKDGQVMYPRDPNAPISEVIRCGCTHIPYAPEWGAADKWAESFMTAQDKANKREEVA